MSQMNTISHRPDGVMSTPTSPKALSAPPTPGRNPTPTENLPPGSKEGRHADALTAFSFGLVQDPNDKHLLEGLIKAATECNLEPDFDFRSKYNILCQLGLENKPFIVLAVLGQELLAQRLEGHAVIVLESALKIGHENRKLEAAVLATVSHALLVCHQTDNNYQRAIKFMREELRIEKQLGDVSGQCRVYANLGYTFYKMEDWDASLDAHRAQLKLAMNSKLFDQAAKALNALGHVHVARNDFEAALTSHRNCLVFRKQVGDNEFNLFKEILAIGYINTLLGDRMSAEKSHEDATLLLKNIAKQSDYEYHVSIAMLKFNQAHSFFIAGSIEDARHYFCEFMKITKNLPQEERESFEIKSRMLKRMLSSSNLNAFMSKSDIRLRGVE